MYEKIHESKRKKTRRSKKKPKYNKKYKNKYDFTPEDLKKIRDDLPDIDYTMDGSVKQLFLNLTKMQIVFNKEQTLEPLLPDGLEKDAHGNYFMKIGDSKTMFCAHLDTYSRVYARVYHKIEDNIIKTDGTTTLGGDDKAGVVVMTKMIEAGVPGLYYFFRGEEGVTSPSGTWGSRQALKSYKDNFATYEKCVAFDRKGNSSIISSQSYTECCSQSFVNALSKQFADNGLEYKDDPTGMWCDSAVFMETIPECTNISVGYKNEHTYSEYQDIEHLEKLAEACTKIDWESLPAERDPKQTNKRIGRYYYDWDWDWESSRDYSTRSTASNYYRDRNYRSGRDIAGKREYVTMDDMFGHIVDILSQLDYECMNINQFDEAEEMYFFNYGTNDFFGLRIVDFDIYLSDDETLKSYSLIGDLDLFEEYLLGDSQVSELDQDAMRHLDSISKESSPKIINRDLSNKRYSFTKEQELRFLDFTKDVPSMAIIIIDECGDKAKRLPAELADRVGMEMMDYGFKGIADAYDYTDWIYDNFELVQELINESSSSSKENRAKKKQSRIFTDLVQKSPNFTKLIINEMDEDGKNGVSVPSDLWIRIEKFMVDNGYKPSYDEIGGINADDFVEWIYDNMPFVNGLIDGSKTNIIKNPNNNATGFMATVDDIKNNTNEYNAFENKLFSKIVDNEKALVKLIMKDIDIHEKPEVRDTTSDKIIDLLDHKYDIKGDPIYASMEFIHWIYDYSVDILAYYTDNK